MILSKQKLKTSTSVRAVVLSYMISSSKTDTIIPTHTTLLNWLHKIGYYLLTRKKEKASDWIIILDESIQLGTDKVLVIFGIREDFVPFRVVIE